MKDEELIERIGEILDNGSNFRNYTLGNVVEAIKLCAESVFDENIKTSRLSERVEENTEEIRNLKWRLNLDN